MCVFNSYLRTWRAIADLGSCRRTHSLVTCSQVLEPVSHHVTFVFFCSMCSFVTNCWKHPWNRWNLRQYYLQLTTWEYLPLSLIRVNHLYTPVKPHRPLVIPWKHLWDVITYHPIVTHSENSHGSPLSLNPPQDPLAVGLLSLMQNSTHDIAQPSRHK